MDRRDRDFNGLSFNTKTNTIRVTITNDDEEMEVDFPAKFEVCSTCSGRGSHVNPNIDRNGISREDFDADQDFEEEYSSGRYDVQCYECRGLRVVPAVDTAALSVSQKADFAIWEEQEEDKASRAREDAYTRRMESGGH
jgi:hypothetical protein